MKALLQILFLFGFTLTMQAQENSKYRIIRSNLGSSGSTQNIVTAKGTYNVSQSIGQSSVIGTHYNNGFYLRQGYQQPLSKIKVVEEFNYDLTAKVYPNPFEQEITISFSNTMLNDISVLVFDVAGKMIYSQEFLPAQKVKLTMEDISNGTYFLKVLSNGKLFKAKLIKF